jgi:CRISPR system Cascade subunit CasD
VRSVLLRLEGPLQAWGTQGRFSERDTDAEPSKSGVLGLVGAALGMPREDDARLAALNRLVMAVRVDREGRMLRDYHTTGGGSFPGYDAYFVAGLKDPVISNRYYLMDAAFTVALGGDDHALVDEVAAALQAPRYPLFLGRRSCVPTSPVFLGLTDDEPRTAVRNAARIEAEEREKTSSRSPTAPPEERVVRYVFEARAGEESEAFVRSDVAQSFKLGARRFSQRLVKVEREALPPPAQEEV